MRHRLYRLRLQPLTAFATALRGDTLFGQSCWTLRHALGEPALGELLHGYTEGRPFLVLSDAFPAGYLPRPEVPLGLLGYDLGDPGQRKQIKAQRWIDQAAVAHPLHDWHRFAGSDRDIARLIGRDDAERRQPLSLRQARGHNSLNRLTGTTGKGDGFAPYERELLWHHPALELELYACCDERLDEATLADLLARLGNHGYGKDASAGLGKFAVRELQAHAWPQPDAANAWLTLAPSAPQGGAWQAGHCYYRPHVRFGRHGDQAVQAGSPYKNPLLLADSAALLTPATAPAGQTFCGQGLGGLSLNIAGTVHQGYAPLVAVALDTGARP